jgi:glycine/D-amino acid oxidase-like deaminating enzyme
VTAQIADLSHWWAQIHPRDAGPVAYRPSLTESRDADVVIVGAGYTGLWTAYELLRAEPTLDVVVLEAQLAGYGASGRNGGAVIAQIGGSRRYWAKKAGREGAIAMERAVQGAVDEIGEAIAREKIDCDYGKNGVLMVARNEVEEHHFRAYIEEDRTWGFGPEDGVYLDAAQLAERMHVAGARGARFSPHCASIHPGRLVRGLAEAVERLGATIYEQSPVTEIAPGRARVGALEVRAKHVVRATEAYSESIPSLKRHLVPVATSMIATVPLTDAQRQAIGWDNREALLAEHPFLHLQRTADNRITIGGDDPRVPYLYGSRAEQDRPSQRIVDHFRGQLAELFPALEGIEIENTWNGVFGATRDWAPEVGIDHNTGLAWAGGYVGEGVAASNLAGRTMRDLLLGRSTELTALPMVRRATRKWEPEPLRYIGAAAIWGMRTLGERNEVRSGKPSKLWSFANKIAGFDGRLG